MTPVFLSWSGARSDRLATAIQRLLAALAPELPTHRSADLAKGEPWSEGLLAQLRGSGDVLICVTPEALASTWITYEAGFIYGSTDKARVFTILFEVEPTDVPGPLQQFQSTRLVESDVRRLVAAIAGSDAAGDQWGGAWENFAADVAEIPPLLLDEIEPEIERWFRRKTFDEPVDQCMDQSWTDRYAGVVETLERLRAARPRVVASGAGFAAEVFDGLVGAVDSYATAIKGLLLTERPRLPTTDDGRVAFDQPGDLEALESRRRRVKSLLHAGINLRPFAQPETFLFERLETFAEKKDLVHAKRAQLSRDLDAGRLDAAMVASWRESEWAFDRIAAYLVDALDPPLDPPPHAVANAALELEKAKATDGVTLMPLHYSLKAVEATKPAVEEMEALLADVDAFLAGLPTDRVQGPAAVVARLRRQPPR